MISLRILCASWRSVFDVIVGSVGIPYDIKKACCPVIIKNLGKAPLDEVPSLLFIYS